MFVATQRATHVGAGNAAQPQQLIANLSFKIAMPKKCDELLLEKMPFIAALMLDRSYSSSIRRSLHQ